MCIYELFGNMDINTAVHKFSMLIETRMNERGSHPRSFLPLNQSPMRILGEMMLNRFANQLSTESILIEQKEDVINEILENVVSSFALAGMLGIDLGLQINELISLLESISAEAS